MSPQFDQATSPARLTMGDRALLGIAVLAAGLMISLLVFAARALSEGRSHSQPRGNAPGTEVLRR